jgi:hypothetical protein
MTMEPIINPNDPPGEVKMPTPEESRKRQQEFLDMEIVDSIPHPPGLACRVGD